MLPEFPCPGEIIEREELRLDKSALRSARRVERIFNTFRTQIG